MIKKIKKDKGLTFIELLVILLLLTSAALVVIFAIKPKKYIDRARDNKMAADLDKLKKALEDFYNDNNCYPKPDQICYNPSSSSTRCNICGKKNTPEDFKQYMNPLPCHFSHPGKDILYEVDNTSCPTLFRIYIDLLDPTNPLNTKYQCANGGCGPSPNYGYDYGVTSPNTNLTKAPVYYCMYYNVTRNPCRSCGGYEQCIENTNCRDGKIYGTSSCSD